MIPTRRFLLALAGCALAAALPLAAADEVLVLQDGTRVEVRGEVERRSGRVLYTDPGGTLRSIRASEVDWDATERAASESAEHEQPAVPAAAPEVVLSIDNSDVAAHKAEKTVEDQAGPVTADASSGLLVEQWERVNTEQGDVIRGQVRNTLDRTVLRVEIELLLQGFDGGDVGRAVASVPSIEAGQTASFEARLEGGPAVRDIVFRFDRMVLRPPALSSVTEGAASPDDPASQTTDDGAVEPAEPPPASDSAS